MQENPKPTDFRTPGHTRTRKLRERLKPSKNQSFSGKKEEEEKKKQQRNAAAPEQKSSRPATNQRRDRQHRIQSQPLTKAPLTRSNSTQRSDLTKPRSLHARGCPTSTERMLTRTLKSAARSHKIIPARHENARREAKIRSATRRNDETQASSYPGSVSSSPYAEPKREDAQRRAPAGEGGRKEGRKETAGSRSGRAPTAPDGLAGSGGDLRGFAGAADARSLAPCRLADGETARAAMAKEFTGSGFYGVGKEATDDKVD